VPNGTLISPVLEDMTAVYGRGEGPRKEDREDMKDRLLDEYVKTCNI